MKKAKLMFAGITIIGIIGGIMAFNAKKSTGTILCSDTPTLLQYCTNYADITASNEDGTLFCTDPSIPGVTMCATRTKVKFNP